MSAEPSSSSHSSCDECSRRRFMQLAGVTAGAVATTAAGVGTITPTASAIPSTPIGTSTGAAGYFTRALDNITGGQTVEPGSSTPEAIAESWYRTGMYAKEHDQWALDQIWNTLEAGQTPAYVRAKTAALEAIADGQTKQDVVDAALEKVDEHYAMVQSNMLEHWEAQVNKLLTARQEFAEHDDVDNPTDYVRWQLVYKLSGKDERHESHTLKTKTIDVTLADGTDRETTALDILQPHTTPNSGYKFTGSLSPEKFDWNLDGAGRDYVQNGYVSFDFRVYNPQTSADILDRMYFHDNIVTYQGLQDTENVSFGDVPTEISRGEQYLILWDRITNQHSMVSDNIETAVTEHYSSVTYGDATVEELVANDPYVLAQEWSTDRDQTGHLAYAAADLAVLGLSFDSDHRMAFKLDDGTTLEGTLYLSEEDEQFEHDVGVKIDPAARSADFYIAADTATMSRPLPADDYRDAIDGGEAKLNVSAVEDTQYIIETAHDETVSVAWDAWEIEDTTANEDVMLRREADSLVVDLSDELEQPITSIESITHTYYGDDDAMVMQVDQPFTITEAYDVETGEEVDTIRGQGYNPRQTDLDFSWTDSYLEMRDDTDSYAQSDSSGGGGGGLNWNGMDWSWVPNPFGLGGPVASIVKIALTAILAAVGVNELVLKRDDDRARQ